MPIQHQGQVKSWATEIVLPMRRFWLYFGGLLPVCLAFGCSHRSMEGMWTGPIPSVSNMDPCRIRLQAGEAFDFRCPGPVVREGVGVYKLHEDAFVLEIHFLAENGKGVESHFLPETYRVSGPGNEITLSPPEPGKPIVWKREAP